MDAKQQAKNIKHEITFQLIIDILEERGVMTDKELKTRLINTVQLSKTLDEETKKLVLEEIEGK